MEQRPQLKICGVTNPDDARLVSNSGADFCGVLVDVGFSERSLSLERAREVAAACTIPVVVLVCDPKAGLVERVAREIGPYAVQFLGHEPPALLAELKAAVSCRIWKTIHLPAPANQASAEAYAEAGVDAFLIDSSDASEGFLRLGGTGKVVDWGEAAAAIRRIPRPVFLAGGIGPENVGAALEATRPFGIDLCSGVEATRGRKDPEKIARLVAAFQAAAAGMKERER